MQDVRVLGVGMTPFTRAPGRGIRDLARAAARTALADAGLGAHDVSRVYFGNAAAGAVTRQEMIRGQVALRDSELGGIPLINVENACASGGTGISLGWEAVATGLADVVLIVGVEQMSHEEKSRTFDALRGSTDVSQLGEASGEEPATHSLLMDFYAEEARKYLASSGAGPEDFARVAVKNRRHAALNPLAQYREPQTVEQVMGGRSIVEPLTLAMCSPVTDGAAAIVLGAADRADRRGRGAPRLLTSQIRAARGAGSAPVADAAAAAFEQAGMGPDDLDLIELHDAAAPAELLQYAEIGLCGEGEGHILLRSGATEIGGATPVNTSGGLMSRGHPLGATGCAQVVELYQQLCGRAEGRQVQGAKAAMAVNAGGWLDGTYATAVASVVTV